MAVKVNSSELAKKLEQVVKVVANKNVMQILADVMIEVRGSVIVLTTSDSEIWLSVKCPLIEEAQEVKFCVNARDFIELIKNINDREIVMSIDAESCRLLCDYGNGNFSMPYDDANEFPTPNMENENTTSVIVEGEKIMKAIELTSFAVGNSITRPIMNGIHFNFSEDGMIVSSTNTHKVVVYKDKSINGGNMGEFVLPKKPSSILSSILSLENGDVKISFGGSAISVNNTNFKLSARLLEGRFFDCESLTRAVRPISVTIDKGLALQALKRVTPMTSDVSNLVVLFFEQGKVTITADNSVFGKSASETIACDCDSELRIGFKCSDLIELFKNVEDDNIVMEMANPMGGVVVYASSMYSRDEYVSLLASSETAQNQ